MKYSLVKKLIKKDIKNIFLALSNDDYDLSETGGNIINVIDHARILFCTLDSEISYNYKVNDLMINLWIEVEKDPDLVPLLNTYGKNKILACVLLYNRASNKTLSMLNNSKISYVCDELLADVNVIDNINEVVFTDISDGCTLTNNTIYINSNGNIIYNIPGIISYFSFYIIGALPTEIITADNLGIVGDAISSGFKITIEGNRIIGESINNNYISTNCGNLLQIKLDEIPDFIDFIEFKDSNSNPITVNYYKNTTKTETISTNAYNFSFKYKIDSDGYIKKTSWNNYYDTSLEDKVFIQTSNTYLDNDSNSENFNKLILRNPGSVIWNIPNYYTDSNSSSYDDVRKYNIFANSEDNLVGTVTYDSSSLNEDLIFNFNSYDEENLINENDYTNVEYGGNNDDSDNDFFNMILDSNDELYNNKKKIRITKTSELTDQDINNTFKLRFDMDIDNFLQVTLISVNSNVYVFESSEDIDPPNSGIFYISKDVTNVEYGGNNDDSNEDFYNTITNTNDELYNNKKRIKVIKETNLDSSNIGQIYKLRFNDQILFTNVTLISINSNEHIFESVDDLSPPLNGKVSISQDIAIFDYEINSNTAISNNDEIWIKSTLQQNFIDACKSSWVNTILKNM